MSGFPMRLTAEAEAAMARGERPWPDPGAGLPPSELAKLRAGTRREIEAYDASYQRNLPAVSSISFVVPGPPVPCARARVYRDEHGKVGAVTPAKTRAYKKHVGMLALAARSNAAGPTWNPDVLYRVTLRVYRREVRGDWDNYAKAICDALTGILWRDDSQVVEAHVFMHVDRVKPRAEVTVEMHHGT